MKLRMFIFFFNYIFLILLKNINSLKFNIILFKNNEVNLK